VIKLHLNYKIMKKKVFAGIDVSKNWIDVTFFIESDIKSKHYKRFDNNKNGYQKMIFWIEKMVKVEKPQIYFCLEHTGAYSMLLSIFLSENQYNVWVEHALQIKRSLGMKREKNDKLDSSDIALYLYRHLDKFKQFKTPNKLLLALQDLEAYRERLIKTKLLLSIPANELNTEINEENTGFIIDSSEYVLHSITEQIKEVDSEITTLIESNSELKEMYELATSIKGIGKQIAVYLIIHTHGFTSFENVRQLACYCGLAPFAQTSGSSVKTRNRVSHFANKKLKTLLHMGATNAIRYDPEMKQFYDRKKQEGKHHLCIMNIVKNKLISRIFAVVKRKSKFMSITEYQLYKKAA